MSEEEHKELIAVIKQKRIKPLEVIVLDTKDGKWIVPMNTSMTPMKIV